MVGVYTVALAAVPVLLWAAYSYLSYVRFKQYEHLPRPPPSLIWGALATIGEFSRRGDSRRHIGMWFNFDTSALK